LFFQPLPDHIGSRLCFTRGSFFRGTPIRQSQRNAGNPGNG
jgi:hypothetical protein